MSTGKDSLRLGRIKKITTHGTQIQFEFSYGNFEGQDMILYDFEKTGKLKELKQFFHVKKVDGLMDQVAYVMLSDELCPVITGLKKIEPDVWTGEKFIFKTDVTENHKEESKISDHGYSVKIIGFVKNNPDCTPNQVYRSINGYDWDPEYNIDIDAQSVADDLKSLVSSGIITMSRDFKLRVKQVNTNDKEVRTFTEGTI